MVCLSNSMTFRFHLWKTTEHPSYFSSLCRFPRNHTSFMVKMVYLIYLRDFCTYDPMNPWFLNLSTDTPLKMPRFYNRLIKNISQSLLVEQLPSLIRFVFRLIYLRFWKLYICRWLMNIFKLRHHKLWKLFLLINVLLQVDLREQFLTACCR